MTATNNTSKNTALQNGADDSNRVRIFDTTLRDGEQSPGCSMNLEEKVRVALILEEMGVDIIEAGFPIASNGDFDAVREVASVIKTSSVAGLARASSHRSSRATSLGVACRASGQRIARSVRSPVPHEPGVWDGLRMGRWKPRVVRLRPCWHAQRELHGGHGNERNERDLLDRP